MSAPRPPSPQPHPAFVHSGNAIIAAGNRGRFEAARLLALDLVSCPGAGTPTLVIETFRRWSDSPAAVILNRDRPSNDLQRLHATGMPILSIDPGPARRLDAARIAEAIDRLSLPECGLLFIDDLGEPIGPTEIDLGETIRIVVCPAIDPPTTLLDNPVVWPATDLLLVSKIDLLPHPSANVEALITAARHLHPEIAVIRLSARTGEGMSRWLSWLRTLLAARQLTTRPEY
ncbi:MAG TPA: hydrogenase accessory protein HypB [Xanthomonadales bacterium]|nr:hydrogenase accessory protein HypB [Xanthomonadales bacterium]